MHIPGPVPLLHLPPFGHPCAREGSQVVPGVGVGPVGVGALVFGVTCEVGSGGTVGGTLVADGGTAVGTRVAVGRSIGVDVGPP